MAKNSLFVLLISWILMIVAHYMASSNLSAVLRIVSMLVLLLALSLFIKSRIDKSK